MSFREAGAEALPFADDRFDVVTCRIAAHHFADPVAFVQEVARVLRPGGLFLLVDNVAPQDPVLAEAMNRIDRERDPSHVEAYTVARRVGWFAEVGLDLTYLTRLLKPMDFRDWVERAQMPASAVVALERYVLELPAQARSYFEVVEEGGALTSVCV